MGPGGIKMLKQKSMRIWICKNCDANIHGSTQRFQGIEYEPGVEIIGTFCSPFCEEEYNIKMALLKFISLNCVPVLPSYPRPWISNRFEWNAEDEEGLCFSTLTTKGLFTIEVVHAKHLGKIFTTLQQDTISLRKVWSNVKAEGLTIRDKLVYKSFDLNADSKKLAQVLEWPVKVEDFASFDDAKAKATELQQLLLTLLSDDIKTEKQDTEKLAPTSEDLIRMLSQYFN